MKDRNRVTTQAAEEFAKRLRRSRDRQGLTQSQLGEKAGLSAAAVSQLESGERKPNFATIVHLAKALSMTPNAIMGVEEEGSDPSLRGLFRKLEGFSAEDVEKVKAFVSFLDQEDKRKEKG
ncbi:MAG: helix-turn-helix transcriptional regulator [Gemmatimonadetes bacterium]|nr:helix-turn-helix transcriptional regulator [Gemmatimonadota bacterium]